MKYEELLKELYGQCYKPTEMIKDPSRIGVFGLFHKTDISENLKILNKFGFGHIVVLGDSDPCVDGVTFVDDYDVIKNLEYKISPKQYRDLYSFNRLNKMVNLRNRLLNLVRNLESELDYFILIDLDLKIIPESIINLINYASRGKVLTSMGIQIKNYSNIDSLKNESCNSIIYYDTSAYRGIDDDRINSIHDNLNCHLHSVLGGVVRDCIRSRSDLIRVNSAFGGCAIYPINCCDCWYELIKNPRMDSNIEYECEHVNYNLDLQFKLGMSIYILRNAFIIYE